MRIFACLLVVAGTAGTASAETITFSDFSSTGGIVLNGSAAVATTSDGQVLRLTPAAGGQSGSAFSQTQINANSFSTAFEFRFTNPGGLCDNSGQCGADGIVFVVQPISSSIGGAGGGIGYSGINPSVGVEFDNWWNQEPSINDPDSNHIGIDVNGNVMSQATAPISTDFNAGDLWTAWVDYNGSILEVRTNTTGVRPLLPNLALALDIDTIIGQNTAFVGFTSGTGGAFANHDIVSWTYSSQFVPGGVIPGEDPATPIPEPASLILLGTGGLGVIARARRKKQRIS